MDYNCQAPPSMGFFPGKNTGGVAISSTGDLLDPGTEPVSCIAGGFFNTEPSGKP